LQLLGYLIAGHETSGTTLGWILKYLSDNQATQEKLRRQLRVAYPEALKQERHPSASEIIQVTAPYLDAFLEECLRHTVTIPILMRQATVDTTILGHRIPKDTNVMLFTLGSSMTEPSVPIQDDRRSESSRASKERVPDWDNTAIDQFIPERWLKSKAGASQGLNEFDHVEFDSQAGPFITFGGGPRGCFGRRLAYLELRLAIALLVWNFDFQPCSPSLSTYDGIDVFTTVPKQCYVKLTKV
jgi:cytochrome P450